MPCVPANRGMECSGHGSSTQTQPDQPADTESDGCGHQPIRIIRRPDARVSIAYCFFHAFSGARVTDSSRHIRRVTWERMMCS